MLQVCRTPGPTTCLKLLQKVCLKRWRKEKKSLNDLGSLEPATIRLMLKRLQESARQSGHQRWIQHVFGAHASLNPMHGHTCTCTHSHSIYRYINNRGIARTWAQIQASIIVHNNNINISRQDQDTLIEQSP